MTPVTSGNAFSGMSASVGEVEKLFESLVGALTDVHVTLDPCNT